MGAKQLQVDPSNADQAHDARSRAIEALHATVATHETPNGVLFGSGTWLVTGRRR